MHDAYMWVTFLHHLAAIAWLGWVLLGPWWLAHAFTSDDTSLLAHMRKSALRMTLVCVGGGALLAWFSGWPMARTLSPDAFSFYWLQAGTGAFIAATLLWLVVLLPLYRRLLAQRAANGMHPRLQSLAWMLGAAIAAILGLATLWLMTVRPI